MEPAGQAVAVMQEVVAVEVAVEVIMEGTAVMKAAQVQHRS